MDISLVIPVYNEKNNLPILYKQICSVLEPLKREFEVIFVDDGSKDSSPEFLAKLQTEDSRLQVIRFDQNYGRASCFHAGFRRAKGNFILIIDSDLQCDMKDFLRVLKDLQTNDGVISFRTNRRQVDGMFKFLQSQVANAVRNFLLGEHFRDVGSTLCGYRRECLNDIVLFEGLELFFPSMLFMLGYRIKEIGIKTYPRQYGRSRFNIRNRMFKELFALFVVRWFNQNKLRYKIIEK